MTHHLVPPYGGKLVSLSAGEEESELLKKSRHLRRLRMTRREASDLNLILSGALSPLKGFMCRKDYQKTLESMQLDCGLPWTIPITFATTREDSAGLKEGEEVVLEDGGGDPRAVLTVEEGFEWDKQVEAMQVYGTDDPKHPGVVYMLRHRGEVLLGGSLRRLKSLELNEFGEFGRSPAEVREAFARLGWQRVVGFQTRNPVHRAHEYIIKCALESNDGVLLHPLVGETTSEDLPAQVRMESYKVLINHYFPRGRILLSVLPAAMRYAGPREAVHHAIMRRNYGCSHFIVGRDHAGVGSYYGTYDAQKIFDAIDREALGVTILNFENAFYCKRCHGMATTKTCSHAPAHHVTLSGTEVRRLVRSGQTPPPEISRPEVAEVLLRELAVLDFSI
jgi:sulfate adenylyltransferase